MFPVAAAAAKAMILTLISHLLGNILGGACLASAILVCLYAIAMPLHAGHYTPSAFQPSCLFLSPIPAFSRSLLLSFVLSSSYHSISLSPPEMQTQLMPATYLSPLVCDHHRASRSEYSDINVSSKLRVSSSKGHRVLPIKL